MRKNELVDLDRPIVIVGAARSGTTVVGKILAGHPSVIYVEEPNVVWRYSNAQLDSDYIPAALATPPTIKYINRFFQRKLSVGQNRRLVEKTPSNSLRLAFVRQVLPNSKIIHVLRDGRDVAFSALRKWDREIDGNSGLPGESKRFRYLRKQIDKVRMIPPRDFAYYFGAIFNALLFSWGIKKRSSWGPRLPNHRELVARYSRLEVCALQWLACVDAISRDSKDIRADDFIEIRYEDLCSAPHQVLLRLYEFCELDVPYDIETMASMLSSSRSAGWREMLSPTQQQRMDMLIGKRLVELGYNV